MTRTTPCGTEIEADVEYHLHELRCTGCLKIELAKKDLQNDQYDTADKYDHQIMDEFAREFFPDEEGKTWAPGFSLGKLLEMVRERFVLKRVVPVTFDCVFCHKPQHPGIICREHKDAEA